MTNIDFRGKDDEDRLQELYLAFIRRGQKPPTWLRRQMEALGMGDHINGYDDGEQRSEPRLSDGYAI